MYSQNVRGIKSATEKLNVDVITGLMLEKNIDAYCLQETWLNDDFTRNVNGFHIFHHGYRKKYQKSNRGERGVAIILSPRLYSAYLAAGGHPPVFPSPDSDDPTFLGRYISIQLKLLVDNNKKGAFSKKSKRKPIPKTITISSVYHPDKIKDQRPFHAHLSKVYDQIRSNHLFVSGQDMNADMTSKRRRLFSPTKTTSPGRTSTLRKRTITTNPITGSSTLYTT